MNEKGEISFDLKNDIKIAFDLFKNENNKITKLKLRTLLFSFIMFESSAGDINRYIEEKTSPDQDLFDLDDVNDLIKEKIKDAKIKEANELTTSIVGADNAEIIKQSQLEKAFQKHNIDINSKDLKEMFYYMNENEDINNKGNNEKELTINIDKFKNFYINN